MDDFFVRAVLGGVGVTLAAGPLGCFLVWRRMAFFGAALSHSALLGVALGFLLGINLTVGIALLCLSLATLLLLLERQQFLSSDTLLAILAHGALAVGLVTIAFMENLRIDLMAYLFGDVLAIGIEDLYLIYGLAMVTAVTLVFLWRPLLSVTVEQDIAAVEGVPVARVRLVFVLLIATFVAVGMKVVGMLLIISLLIIPAAAARRLSKTPEQMAVIAVLIGALSVVFGLLGSLKWDIPAGPAIVALGALVFAIIIVWPRWQTPPVH